MTEPRLEVLVVDDSALVRQILSALLTAGGMSVAAASDPLIAMRKMRERRPDVIVLDLEMPRMDGLTFLRRIMAEDPIPVVICSSHAGRGSRTAIEGLVQGAVDVIGKPQLGVSDFLHHASASLLDTIRAASRARPRGRLPPRPREAGPASRKAARRPDTTASGPTRSVVAIGVSTGGPEALETILTALDPDCPALAIVQHMPQGFTAALAQRLDRISQVDITEARDGELLAPGRALIAPGGRHLFVECTRAGLVARVKDGPPVSRHRPSVDVLFRSVARAAGRAAAGALLTGMGSDGAAGMEAIKQAGGRTLAQDESSSVVHGMPRSAIERGCVDEVLPLLRMAEAIQGFGRREAERAAREPLPISQR